MEPTNGHSQTLTTMRYTHLRAEDTKEALESLGRNVRNQVDHLQNDKRNDCSC